MQIFMVVSERAGVERGSVPPLQGPGDHLRDHARPFALRPSMNLPNILTLSRIPLMFFIVGLAYLARGSDAMAGVTGAATAALALFIVAGITDWLDGAIARRRGLTSTFGALMDALTDKILLLGIMIALVDFDRINIFLVLLILGREFLITGMRLVAASRGVVVSAEKAGKQKTMTQILAIGGFLLVDALRLDWSQWLPWDLTALANGLDVAAWLAFLLAVFFTLSSGVRYFVKYRSLVFADA
jgi:CDP-diacylglycerol---glycerol-3-phosphate 3-phosphatidyltransferase